MFTEELELLTKDGLKLYGKCWIPDTEPKKIICLVHGLGEHIGRYEAFSNFFTSLGIAVFAADMRGHGKSGGKRGHVPNYDLLHSDIEELLKAARVAFNDTPIVLYGHSLGGNFVGSFALQNKIKEMEALVLSSPWLRLVTPPSEGKKRLINLASKLWPSFTQPTKLDPNGLCADKSIVQKYIDDPLVHDAISVGLFQLADQNGERMLQEATSLELPAFVLHGAKDTITSPKASQEFAEKSGAKFQLLPNAFHEPHNEPDKEATLTMIKNWILQPRT